MERGDDPLAEVVHVHRVQRLPAPREERYDVEAFGRAEKLLEETLAAGSEHQARPDDEIRAIVELRFDLERALLAGDLQVHDLPRVWNERIESDLGLKVPDDRRGCLQDVHWSMGAIGYFPTYTLGTLYAAQFWEAIERDVPDVERRVEGGDFAAVLGWLRDRVHRHGRRFPARELCLEITGAPLGHAPLIRHLWSKLGEIYGLAGS